MNKGSLKDYIRLLEKENAEMREVLCRATSTAEYWCGVSKELCFDLDFAVSVLEDQIFDLEDEVETSSMCINCNYFDCTADSECEGIFKEEEE